MRQHTFRQRVETIFKGFEVFMYAEAPKGPSRDIKGLDDYRPWVEFDLRPLTRKHSMECCHVSLKELVKLSRLLGTGDITVTGFDMGYDCPHHRDDTCEADCRTDYVGYVLARGVKFP